MKPNHRLFYQVLIGIIIATSLITYVTLAQEKPKVFWDKIAFPVLMIQDSTFIQTISEELFIPLEPTTDRLALVDLNFDGPGVKDIIIVYPSCQTFPLDFLPEKVSKMMRRWPAPDLRKTIVAHDSLLAKLSPEKFKHLPLIKSLREYVRTIYGEEPLKVFYSQSENGLEIEILRIDLENQLLWEGARQQARLQKPMRNLVVLGSSTAEGTGPADPKNAWVRRFRAFANKIEPQLRVVNLAKGGYTTYQMMPNDYVPPPGRPAPDSLRNITIALRYNPLAIIINLPSNDAAAGFSVKEQLANYDSILARAVSRQVPVWITTTQPRNFAEEKRKKQMVMRDSTLARFRLKAIDFWSGIAREDGTIQPQFDCGDGIHLNDQAHAELFKRVVATGILDSVQVWLKSN